MKIDLNAKNYKGKDIEKLTEIINKKFARLEKFFTKEMQVKIILSNSKNEKCRLEASVYQSGMPVPVRAEAIADTMFENIDLLLPRLEKQIVKIRTRQTDKKKSRIELPFTEEPFVGEKEKIGKVVKVKNFNISITTVDDAIDEMELLDHSFHLFVNAENNKVSVVYKRNDGDYALITPEY